MAKIQKHYKKQEQLSEKDFKVMKYVSHEPIRHHPSPVKTNNIKNLNTKLQKNSQFNKCAMNKFGNG